MDVFMHEVKKIFPNATRRAVHNSLNPLLGATNFTWKYGDVSLRNMPKKDHATIRKINNMARGYTLKRGFKLKSMITKKR